jgi:hypothetical protein
MRSLTSLGPRALIEAKRERKGKKERRKEGKKNQGRIRRERGRRRKMMGETLTTPIITNIITIIITNIITIIITNIITIIITNTRNLIARKPRIQIDTGTERWQRTKNDLKPTVRKSHLGNKKTAMVSHPIQTDSSQQREERTEKDPNIAVTKTL